MLCLPFPSYAIWLWPKHFISLTRQPNWAFFDLYPLSSWFHENYFLLSWDTSQGYFRRLRDPLPPADLWITSYHNALGVYIDNLKSLVYPLYSKERRQSCQVSLLQCATSVKALLLLPLVAVVFKVVEISPMSRVQWALVFWVLLSVFLFDGMFSEARASEWRWQPDFVHLKDAHPDAFPLLKRLRGENEVKNLMYWCKDREITY